CTRSRGTSKITGVGSEVLEVTSSVTQTIDDITLFQGGALVMPLPKTGAKMSRTLAREEAYFKLRQWIIDGTLQPGEVLRDQEIASLVGVSRTPVREALRRLEDENLVETALNRWTRVAPLDFTKIAESYAIIEALEVMALELAFPYLTAEDLQGMANA